MPEALTIGTVVSLALGSSVVGAVITQGTSLLRDGRTARREVTYLALRLATIFERFAEDAADVVGSVNDFRSNGQIQGVNTTMPKLEALPDQKERWRDLEVTLTSQVLGFSELARSKQGSIDNIWNVSSPEDGIDAAQKYAVVLGVRALRLGAALRQRYGLPAFDTPSPWVDFLAEEYDQLPPNWTEDRPAQQHALKAM